MTRRGWGGAAVLAGALVLAGCGAVPGSAWYGSAGVQTSGTAVAGAVPTTATAATTGTVLGDPSPVPSRTVTNRPITVAPGGAAIRPTRESAGPDDPAFTAEDARAYVESHGADGFRMVATGPTTVDRVLFVRGAAAGYPDYPPLCLVLVRGDYHLVPPPGVALRTPVTSDGITLIFDAHTGNDLGASGSRWATPIATR